MHADPGKVLLTGSSGRIGQAIYSDLCHDYHVVGIDRLPSKSTAITADINDDRTLITESAGARAIIHTAALHAPHVGLNSDSEFERINVQGTQTVINAAIENTIPTIVFTSTTALYGEASQDPEQTAWITEQTPPQPQTIYHRTKLAAEYLLEAAAHSQLTITVLRMSRCFPEAAPVMAGYRLHRGIDRRDVASAHRMALQPGKSDFRRYIISFPTPFTRADCISLKQHADKVIAERCPLVAEQFSARRWPLPQSIDRVYDAGLAVKELGWRPVYGYRSVLTQLGEQSLEVLPPL